MSIYTNQATAHNELAAYINNRGPQVLKRLKSGFRLKGDGQLYKKDKTDIDEIIKADRPKKIMSYIDSNNYSMSLYSRISSPVGEFSCKYIERYVYLWDVANNKPIDFAPLELITADHLIQGEKLLKEKTEQRRILDGEISRLRHFLEK